MNILHIGKYYPPFMGGIENFMTDLMRQQVEDGHRVSAIVHHHERQKGISQEVVDGVEIYRTLYYGQLAYAPISPSFGVHLKRVIKKFKPDVIHIHMPNLSAFWCSFFSSARVTPWVIHWHADVIGGVPDLKIKLLYPAYRVFEKLLLSKASAIIATSEAYKCNSKALLAYRNKVTAVPLGIKDKIDCDNVKLNNGRKSNGLYLLIIGRLTYYKGHKNLIEAIAQIKKSGVEIVLKIVGGGELEPKIQQQISELNLDAEVRLLGKLSQSGLHNAINQCDLLCLPSIEKTEAFGVVLLEAARASKPALVTDVKGSGMSWVVQDGVTGLVAKANNVDSLVEKLTWVSQHPDEVITLGRQARLRFEENFKIGVISKRIDDVYRKVISER